MWRNVSMAKINNNQTRKAKKKSISGAETSGSENIICENKRRQRRIGEVAWQQQTAYYIVLNAA